MKLKIKDQIPDIEIFHLVDGEPQTSKIRDILSTGYNHVKQWINTAYCA